MPLTVTCRRCKQELDEPGGLLFSPPDQDPSYEDTVEKYHICVGCYEEIENVLFDGDEVILTV